MLRVKPKYCPAAIEISASSLKLLQLAKLKSSYKIVKADYLSFKVDKNAPSVIPKDALEKLVRANQVKGDVITSIPLDKINIYTYILPTMPAEEIEQALIWKIKQNLSPGVNFDDIYFDYAHNGGQGENSKEIYALVFIAAKKMIADMIKLFKGLSLNLISVEPQPYAIIGLLSLLKYISDQETVLVLQLGSSHSSIAIVSGGYPYSITPLAVSGNGFSEAISGYYQIDQQKAEDLKIKEGLGALQLDGTQEATEGGCLAALSSQLESLVIDIEHGFKYFSHQLVKSKITAFDRLILCGSACSLKNLDKFLSDKLKAPVSVFDPVDIFISHSEPEVKESVRNNSSTFAATLGLATEFIKGELWGPG